MICQIVGRNLLSHFFLKEEAKVNFNEINDVEVLLNLIDPANHSLIFWRTHRNEIKECISKLHKEHGNLSEAFATLITRAIQNNPEKIFIEELFELTTECLGLDILLEFAKKRAKIDDLEFEDIIALASRNIYVEEAIREPTWKQQFYREGRKIRTEVVNFIPNLINTFLSPFSFINNQKNFTTLWEKYLAISILAKFFEIPLLLANQIHPMIGVAKKVYLTTGLIIAAMGSSLVFYKKFFEPVPASILFCSNLSLKAEYEEFPPMLGTIKELNQIVSNLLAGRNIVLVGLSGSGKTTLIQNLTQMGQENQLPQELAKRTVQYIKCGNLVHHPSFGYMEQINRLKKDAEGFGGMILFILDEYDLLCENSAAFRYFKNEILDELPAARFIAITTIERYHEMFKIDTDQSFEDRLEPIFIQDEASDLLLNPIDAAFNDKIPIAESGIKKVIDFAQETGPLEKIGKNRKAVNLFKKVIGKCLYSYDPKFYPESLRKVDQEIALLVGKGDRSLLEQETKIYLKLTQERNKIETQLIDWKKKTKKISQVLSLRKIYRKMFSNLGNRITKLDSLDGIKKHISLKDQKMFLLLDSFRTSVFKTTVENLLKDLQTDLLGPIQVDEGLVILTYNEYLANIAAIKSKKD